MENGDLIVENKWGQFDGFEGAEDYTEAANRKYVKIAENARAASGYNGDDVFAYIDAYGQLWVSGYNTYGALPTESTIRYYQKTIWQKEKQGLRLNRRVIVKTAFTTSWMM